MHRTFFKNLACIPHTTLLPKDRIGNMHCELHSHKQRRYLLDKFAPEPNYKQAAFSYP